MEQRFSSDEVLHLVQGHESGVETLSRESSATPPTDSFSRLLAHVLLLYPQIGQKSTGTASPVEEDWASALNLLSERSGSPTAAAQMLGALAAQFVVTAKIAISEGVEGSPQPGVAERAMRLGRWAYELSAFLDAYCAASPEYALRELDAYSRQAAAFMSPRCDPSEVVGSYQSVKSRYPDRRIVVLTDSQPYIEAIGEGIFCVGKSPKSILNEYPTADTLFFYAFDFDYLGEQWIAEIVRRGGQFQPIAMTERRAKYWHISPTAFQTLRSEFFRQTAEGFDKWDEGDFLNIVQAIDLTASLSGDYVEVGAFNGSSAAIALSYLRSIGMKRHAYIMDVFDGFNYPEAASSADQFWLGSHATDGRQVVEKRLMPRCADATLLHVVKSNIISDPLPAELQRVVVANLDVDMYEAVVAGLDKLAPLIVPDGILIVEDAGHTPALIGARLAVSQFMRTPVGAMFRPVYMESGQTFLIKKAAA